MSVVVTKAILSRLSPDEAAALWKVQADSGSVVEAGLFEAWLAEDAAHVRAWEQLEDAWSVFDDPDDPLFADLRAAAVSAERADRPWPLRGAVAAAAVVALVGSGALLIPRQTRVADAPAERPAASWAIYRAGAEPRTIALADGTEMTLDANASARVAVSSGARRVALERGRALFAVRHDASHPFTVVAGARTIVDLGTRFEVTLAARSVRVALFEGSVRVEGGTRVHRLSPGQILETGAGADRISNASADDSPWSEGLVRFDQITLAQAAEELNAGSPVKLVISDARVAGMRISGRFRLRDPARFAVTVSEILPVRVVRVDPNRIELRYKR